jgi:hypothetical protein
VRGRAQDTEEDGGTETGGTVYTPVLSFGKHRGRALSDVSTSYLRWALGADRLDEWERSAIRAELARRGQRFLPAADVLASFEERLTELVSEEARLDHAAAALVGDLLLLAFEDLRRRFDLGQETELVIPPRRVPADRGPWHEESA